MIHRALLAIHLPVELGPALPTPALEGLENLLFTGRWARRRASCGLSAAVVLARCQRVLHELGCRGLRVTDDAGTVMDQVVPAVLGDPQPRWPEALPPRWTEQPCELAVRGTTRHEGLLAAISLRYTPRHAPEQSALTGALCATWDPGPLAGDPDTRARTLEATLPNERALRELARRLEERGELLAETLTSRLEQAFEAPAGARRGQLVVLHCYADDPTRFAELLVGLPPEAGAPLADLERLLARGPSRWPALDATGVPGHLRAGIFTPNAEVWHAG